MKMIEKYLTGGYEVIIRLLKIAIMSFILMNLIMLYNGKFSINVVPKFLNESSVLKVDLSGGIGVDNYIFED